MYLQLFKFDRSKSFKELFGMFLIFQIFDRSVNIVENFNPDDAQNVRKGFELTFLNS